MFFQFLEKFRHQHGILAAGDTDCDLVALLNQVVGVERPRKRPPDRLAEFFYNTLLNSRPFFLSIRLGFSAYEAGQGEAQPRTVTTLHIDRVKSVSGQTTHPLLTLLTGMAHHVHWMHFV